MKLNDAEMSNWVIELRDGALEIQRKFRFGNKADLDTFIGFVGSYMESPGLMVFTGSVLLPKPEAEVRIHILPERALLNAAGEIAATCEHRYTRLLADMAQFAA
jgi:hypothetical protein